MSWECLFWNSQRRGDGRRQISSKLGAQQGPAFVGGGERASSTGFMGEGSGPERVTRYKKVSDYVLGPGSLGGELGGGPVKEMGGGAFVGEKSDGKNEAPWITGEKKAKEGGSAILDDLAGLRAIWDWGEPRSFSYWARDFDYTGKAGRKIKLHAVGKGESPRRMRRQRMRTKITWSRKTNQVYTRGKNIEEGQTGPLSKRGKGGKKVS